MELHMINIIYEALPMLAQAEKTTFSCKDDQCIALHIYWSRGNGLVHRRSTHGTGHIPLCGIFYRMSRNKSLAWSKMCPVWTRNIPDAFDPGPKHVQNVSKHVQTGQKQVQAYFPVLEITLLSHIKIFSLARIFKKNN